MKKPNLTKRQKLVTGLVAAGIIAALAIFIVAAIRATKSNCTAYYGRDGMTLLYEECE